MVIESDGLIDHSAKLRTTLTALATSPRRGFETAISAHAAAAYVAVQALDAAGGVLATSAPVKP